jgi:pantoate--beta-alanine ligase
MSLGRAVKQVKQLPTLSELRHWRSIQPGKVAFVPTMGGLHSGHLHLMNLAKQHYGTVVACIYVNPTQFAAHEDFGSYPRTLDADLTLLNKAGVDAVFLPGDTEMYPRGREQGTFVEVTGLSKQLEGAVRPHHFRGVATIVTKLINAVQPDAAIFGQKDIQQFCVVNMMAKELLMSVDIRMGETQRDVDGLALSTRNQYLNVHDRKIAPVIYRALTAGETVYKRGERSRDVILDATMNVLNEHKSELTIDYLSIASPDTLEEVTEAGETAFFSAAIRLGKTRLLDNIILGRKPAYVL